ncbi:MAG: hypothetical protein ACYC6H_03665 [Bellilinea sp.]
MNPMRWRTLAGGLLILAGVIALLNSIAGINLGSYVWAILFVLGGIAFLYVMATDKSNWWAAIPGFTLVGIGSGIGVAELLPRTADVLTPVFILGGIGIGFLVVYLLNPSFWWAIIPMGVMLSIVIMIGLEPIIAHAEILFFLGLAATFGVLALLPINNGKRDTWPLYPAAAMLLLAFINGVGETTWAGYLMPVIIILAGGYLVFRAVRIKA